MGKIRILDEHLANQIAAGEVVERPSSVVKELVENAIDAGSTTIDIAIEEGGITLIRVADNGGGIEQDDMEAAFYRHATSKLISGKDLFRIASLGFRGEALPSIAAVSRVECASSPDDSGLGHRLRIEGGTLKGIEPYNMPQGTAIEVRDLFYNTPARLKYMKSIQTELGHISDFVYRLALAHPGIAFSLTHNGNAMLRTIGNGDRKQAIAAIYGTNTARAMIQVDGEHPDYELRGYISKPEETRSNRNSITVIINGRYIRSFAINQAIMQAYHTLLPINRYPLAVLDIAMHPGLVDVNVHPSKMEVRFSKEAELRTFVEEVLRGALGRKSHVASAETDKRSRPVVVQERMSFYQAPESASAPETAVTSSSSSASPSTPLTSQPATASSAVHETGTQAGGRLAERSASYSAPAYAAPSRPEERTAIPADAAERLYKPGGAASAYTVDRARADSRAGEESPGAGWGQAVPSPEGQPAGQPTMHHTEQPAGQPTIHHTERSVGQPAMHHAMQPAVQPAIQPAVQPTMQPPAQPAVQSAAQSAVQPRSTASAQPLPPAEASTPAAAGATGVASPPAGAPGAQREPFPELEWIGQLHGTYLLAQNERGLFMIDQHAAHERINYEYYFFKFGTPAPVSQTLLVPITLEFTSAETGLLRDRLQLFAEAGVELEPFGSNTFLVRAYPEWFPQGDEEAIIREMADLVLAEKKAIDIAKLREKAAIMCACKASIKANQRLAREAAESLIRRLAACNQPYTCPHGRPIVVHLDNYQLEKMFKRVMS